MGKIQVEIYYTDKLESIRVDQQKIEIPTAIKTKPVIAWFGPTGGRVNWRGLAAEIRAMDPNRDENATYNFLFNGPDDKKREFMTCVKNENLGEEAQQESKAKTEQDYLINAENFHQMGNESAAFLNYKIAAEEYDSPQAQYEVAVRYQNGIGVEKSEEKAVGWYYKAAENGFMAAQMEIAKRNECGIGIEKNDEEAVRWYEIAAKNGNLTAQIKMAEQRKNGVEEIKTEREASKWYERIAENENAEELYNVALRYENGNGVQPNVNIAFELYQQAAQKGNSRAQHALGVIYEDGVIAQLDMKKAIEWYEIAAKNGNADAECDLGYCYQFGKGVQRNLNKAIELYEKSASQGNMYGMVELSQQMLEVQNPARCIRMFQLKELTLKKGEDMFQKLSTVYYSSMAQGCSLAVMIDVPDEHNGANIYLGVREDSSKKNMENCDLDTSSKALQKVLLSNFPGSDTRGIIQDEERELLNGAFGEEQEAVASVSCVAAMRDKSKTEDKAFIQGIERFMDAMEGEKYTALFLAEPVSNEMQAAIRSGYENLYSSLSPFRKSTWSYTENESTSVMESLCSGMAVITVQLISFHLCHLLRFWQQILTAH